MTQAKTHGTVGPIIFADETARRQLVEEGEVVTFRASRRTTGSTWWRRSRLGPKQGDVHVEEIGEVDASDPSALKQYRPLSGFSSVAEWQQAIRNLNGQTPTDGILYRVTVDG